MRWSEILPVLVTTFTQLANADDGGPIPPGFEAEWAERRRKAISPEARFGLYLKITSSSEVGEDQVSYELQKIDPEDPESEEDIFEVITGLRKFTLNVRVESTEHSDDLWALEVLERIRTRFKRTSAQAALLDLNVSISEMRPAIKASRTIDKRVWSIGSMDIVFLVQITDRDPVPIGWIEHVNVESRIKNAEGDVIQSPPNNAPGEWIPPLPEEP